MGDLVTDKTTTSCSSTAINAVLKQHEKKQLGGPIVLNFPTSDCQSRAFLLHTCSVRCVTCASSSFSPLAVVDGTGIFLADEGLDVGVEDLGVVELDLDAPRTDKRFITQRRMTDNVAVTQSLFHRKIQKLSVF